MGRRRGGGEGRGGGRWVYLLASLKNVHTLTVLLSFLVLLLDICLNFRVDSGVEKKLIVSYGSFISAVKNEVQIGLFLGLGGRDLTGKVEVLAGSGGALIAAKPLSSHPSPHRSMCSNTDRILQFKFLEHFSLFCRCNWLQDQFSEWSFNATTSFN